MRRGKTFCLQLAVDVNQTHQFVAAVLLIALVPEIDFVGLGRVIGLVEPKQIGLLVALVVGDEPIGSVSDEQPFGVEQAERAQAARPFTIEPGVQQVGLGVMRELAQQVLIAGGLAIVIVVVVEARTGQRHVAGLRMPRLSTALSGPSASIQPRCFYRKNAARAVFLLRDGKPDRSAANLEETGPLARARQWRVPPVHADPQSPPGLSGQSYSLNRSKLSLKQCSRNLRIPASVLFAIVRMELCPCENLPFFPLPRS